MKKTKFKTFKKKSGTLIPISLNKNLPFKSKRIFFIKGKKNFTRGDHAHKKCSQFILPLIGKIELFFESKKNKKKLILNSNKNEGFLIEPKTWVKIKFLSNYSVLMVACDREYEFNDYIENYAEFKKIIRSNQK
jgi:UDP-2-acetamido-3-amino-2,3-dideoxy-glucuronate N-acetyltransferase